MQTNEPTDSVSATRKMKAVGSIRTTEHQPSQHSMQANEPMDSVSATRIMELVESIRTTEHQSNQNSVQANGPMVSISATQEIQRQLAYRCVVTIVKVVLALC